MDHQQTFGNEAQKPPSLAGTSPPAWSVYSGGLLGNEAIQPAIPSWVAQVLSHPGYGVPNYRSLRPSATAAISRLEALKRTRFTPESKDERVAKSLAALNQEESIHLTPGEWRWVAEDIDLEDQF